LILYVKYLIDESVEMDIPTAQDAYNLSKGYTSIRGALYQKIDDAINERSFDVKYTVCDRRHPYGNSYGRLHEDFKNQAEILRDKGYKVTIDEEYEHETDLYGFSITVRWDQL
jgi:hypothetical protein